MDAETLFLETLADLETRTTTGDYYSLIRSAGLLRQLFLDEQPLLHAVNRTYRLAITFTTPTLPMMEWKTFGVSEPLFEVLLDLHPAVGYKTTLDLKHFLAHPVMRMRGETFTVKDVIKFVAHVRGGIHFGHPENNEALLLELAQIAKDIGVLFPPFALDPAVRLVRTLGQVTLAGVRPLRDAILAARATTLPKRTRVKNILNNVMPSPDDFPGPAGTIALSRISPPVAVGENFRCMPIPFGAEWPESIPEFDATFVYEPFVPLTLDQIPPDLTGSRKLDGVRVSRIYSREEILVLVADTGGIVDMAIYFEGPRLCFRLGARIVSMDCTWANGVIGMAMFRWSTERLSITYFATTPDGRTAVRTTNAEV